MAATIRDVALRAGVSKAAVSYVLNGRATSVKITEETKNRIYTAARELNYHPNALARGLARKRMDTIVLIPQYSEYLSVWSGFTGEMMQGISEVIREAGYDVMLHMRSEPTLDQEVAIATDGRADGALLWRLRDDPLAEILRERGFPAVQIFDHSPDSEVAFVDCDNILGGRLAVEYLLRLGHRRLLHLTGNREVGSAVDRRTGYEQALAAWGLPVSPEGILNVEWEYGEEAPYARVAALLRGPDRPTAVFCWYDGVAFRLMKIARDLGLRIPDDLSIIGFDSTEMCNHTAPPLTSVRQPVRAMAAYATRFLIGRIHGEPVEPLQKLFAPELDIRASCAPPSPLVRR